LCTVYLGVAPLADVTFESDNSATRPVPALNTPQPSANTVTPDELWLTILTIPLTTPPGTYYVVARCGYSRRTAVIFAPTPITAAGS
jgi:hypothetical protein